MSKISKWFSVIFAGALMITGVVSTLTVPALAETGSTGPTRSSSPAEITPTFLEETSIDEDSASLWVGDNLLLFGNTMVANTDLANGFLLMAGNTMTINSLAEYGFIAGNEINFNGEVERDLFVAGNSITLGSSATIGRDVFIAGNVVSINTDSLPGDVSVTADTVILSGNEISGNLNLSVERIKVNGPVTVNGRFTYNDDAEMTGASQIKANETEVYTIVEDEELSFAAVLYGKLFSVLALFVIMTLICLVYKNIHAKVGSTTDASEFGKAAIIGLGILVLVPVVAIAALISYVLAPLSIILIALYCVMIYLAQGFAGLWLGHIIMERCFKTSGNVFIEILLGVVILGLCSLIPYFGVLTGLLGLILGLGLIVKCLKPGTSDGAITKKSGPVKKSKTVKSK